MSKFFGGPLDGATLSIPTKIQKVRIPEKIANELAKENNRDPTDVDVEYVLVGGDFHFVRIE